MRIQIAYPKLPPAIDGIGDHTRFLAEALADRHHVEILTADAQTIDALPVKTTACFSMSTRAGVKQLLNEVRKAPPEWLLLQYNPFAWGRWGLNLQLPSVISTIKKTCPGIKVALIVHECFVPSISWKFAIMTTWQRLQLWRLGQVADAIFVSIEKWTRLLAGWYPDKLVVHLPVGSNIPVVGADRRAVRDELGIAEHSVALGVFGSAHPDRMFDVVPKIVDAVASQGIDVSLICAGGGTDSLKKLLPGKKIAGGTALDPREVSRLVSAMDVTLPLFIDGVSTRRGSFMAGLDHGVATVTTIGRNSDAMLKRAAGASFLASDPLDHGGLAKAALELAWNRELREKVAESGRALYRQHFDWSRLVDILTVNLDRKR
ncbi:hypothetical protein LIG30_0018 [Burkholderia sp. lig30]|jgi:glycosyltransferase involved in cell wall biosynthesis|uniref:glycosyltransferase family 4 protein n=1 Tax=Burkholderia sp. lig30 TaxID=1192124 RepID=UPI000460B200|nr:glycosyltransferase family 4 protein [Burkholderia sp. lig30]KDB09698.1 hypothetical protein LIG30_0018 [Burkholderia sp. lig30]